jgi:hypothetical protein
MQCRDHEYAAPVTIVAKASLQPVFERTLALREAAKSGELPADTNAALAWIRSAPDKESRGARKVLAHAMIYGASPETFSELLKRR